MEAADPREFLWNDMHRLGGVVRPRVWSWESDCRPADARLAKKNFAILAQSWVFRESSVVDVVLGLLELELALDRAVWRAQRSFLREFIGGFFGDNDLPAWITVHTVRKGFARRMVDVNVPYFHGGSLEVGGRVPLRTRRSARFGLGGEELPRADVLLFHALDVPRDELQLQRVYIHRTLSAESDRRVLWSTEERLVGVYDREDVRLARRGLTPALERYRDQHDVHSSPLVGLCKYDGQARVINKCFSLSPLIGELADVRLTSYPTEFYIRNNTMYPTMLRSLTTPGQYDTF